MNMTNTSQNEFNATSGFDQFINEEVSILAELNEKRVLEIMTYSKSFLDKVFPLESGSHRDVSSYVIYYTHLLAFFPDGSKSGLSHPKQFVALSGHKSEPTSIVLKNDGFHVELIFNKNGTRGIKDIAGIDDIQVETNKLNFGGENAANDETTEQKTRHWFSMIRNDDEMVYDAKGKQLCRCVDVPKAFTDKNGEDYPLS
ncbi:malate synthase [Psychrosphaera sp. 1_MG-2023]|uniref:Malate synthase n=1 Tax=Psychrosphaera algicola TaxID=3023714 RepID=A0ABT5FHF5_9GAMM|nr:MULTISPECIES: malate synthase [unclassified Psychrosphaera]MDC2890611.1 malate synthase [Psychrosphaera sp. G1-22]MDO6720260.1 malate synthase [Psychrosphaera sp. 1_MG-2023]